MGESQFHRVAILSDVHGNAVALQAVLAELAETDAELVVFGGDLTWGPLPGWTAGRLTLSSASAISASMSWMKAFMRAIAKVVGLISCP